jgi:hypothetical protein
MSKQFYFDELVFANVLSFCSPSIKEVQPVLTTGVYVVKKAHSIKKYQIIEIDYNWLHIKSEWKQGVVSVKKVRNKDPTECVALGFNEFNKLECLFTEEEWKAEQYWAMDRGISIPYRIFNLEAGRSRMAPPLTLNEAMRGSAELEHLVLWRRIQERLAFEKIRPYLSRIADIESLKWRRDPITQTYPRVNTPEQLAEIQTINDLIKPLQAENRIALSSRKRASDLLKILRVENA